MEAGLFENTMLLALKLEERAISQGIQKMQPQRLETGNNMDFPPPEPLREHSHGNTLVLIQ